MLSRHHARCLALACCLVAQMFLAGVAAAQSVDDEQETELSRSKAFDNLGKEVAELEKHSNVLKKVVKLVSPTVVHIEAEKFDATPPRGGRRSHVEDAGSGCIIKLGDQFYVLTNRHVIKNALSKDIKIKLADGRQINPTKFWADKETDVAIMAISAPRLIPARVGNSDDVEIGDFVLAVGSPFGLSHSVTFGIISAKGRRDLPDLVGDGLRFQDFLQTDTAINPGNSGGPLISLRGEVIGMNTAIASNSGGNEGIGFSIPINMVMIIARQLVERGAVTRAFLGVALDSKFSPAMAITVGLSRPRGTRITRVTPGSPADLAKLQQNDVILEFNGVRVDDDSHLINMVSLTEVGKEVPVVFLRDHKLLTVLVKVGAATASKDTSK